MTEMTNRERRRAKGAETYRHANAVAAVAYAVRCSRLERYRSFYSYGWALAVVAVLAWALDARSA